MSHISVSPQRALSALAIEFGPDELACAGDHRARLDCLGIVLGGVLDRRRPDR
jgi:hypothetical protein